MIGILGEYDALPGISQKAMPTKGTTGCWWRRSWLWPQFVWRCQPAAAISIKELIQQGKLKGTIRFYGTPAEEAVGGKIYMAREGLFNDRMFVWIGIPELRFNQAHKVPRRWWTSS